MRRTAGTVPTARLSPREARPAATGRSSLTPAPAPGRGHRSARSAARTGRESRQRSSRGSRQVLPTPRATGPTARAPRASGRMSPAPVSSSSSRSPARRRASRPSLCPRRPRRTRRAVARAATPVPRTRHAPVPRAGWRRCRSGGSPPRPGRPLPAPVTPHPPIPAASKRPSPAARG